MIKSLLIRKSELICKGNISLMGTGGEGEGENPKNFPDDPFHFLVIVPTR